MRSKVDRCDEVKEILSLHLDDELDEVARGWMKRHLANCPDCTRIFREMRAVDNMFQQVPTRHAPPGFTEGVVRRAIEEQARRNLRYGVLVLLLGTLIIASLFVPGQIEWLRLMVSLLLSPTFLSVAWVDELWRTLSILGEVAFIIVRVWTNLLTGPFLVPSLMALLATLFAFIVLYRRQPSSVTVS